MEHEKIDILIVDDREENLFALETVLSSPDLNLVRATSGDEALRYLLHHEPALILMDVQMPEMDGFETTRLIKQSERIRDIPIIFVTAINSEERYVHQGYSHGAVDYISKPYDAYILKSKVSVFVDLAKKSKRVLELEKQEREAERREREQQIIALELKSLKREQVEQRRYLDLVEGINHGVVWSADADSLVIQFVSPSAETILGYPLDQWSSESDFFLKRIPLEDQDKVQRAIQTLKRTKKNIEVDHRFISKSGKEVWLHTGLRIAQKGEDSLYEIRGLSVDITRLKDAEELLNLNKKHSDFLAEASFLLGKSLEYEPILPELGDLVLNSGIADWFLLLLRDKDDQLKPTLVRHRDSKKVALVGATLDKYIPNFSSELLLYPEIRESTLKRFVKNKKDLEFFQALGLRSGLCVPLDSHGKNKGMILLATAESKKTYSFADFFMAQDLARRVSLTFDNVHFYRQAQSAIKVRDEFLSIASHELKTPLTPLKLQMQMLMRSLRNGVLTELKPEKIAKLIQSSDRQLDRIANLVDELLDIAKINQEKFKLSLEQFDLTVMIREILERFNGQIQDVKCSVVTALPESLFVYWDRFRIEQVFINLLTNAMKYGKGRPIHVSVSLEDDRVKIRVKDHGIGIAKEDQERIFQRFERAVSSNHFSGLGLGLYIVTQALEAHQGTIGIESELGEGSTFTLSLPLNVWLGDYFRAYQADKLKIKIPNEMAGHILPFKSNLTEV